MATSTLSFSAQIAAFADKVEGAVEGVFKASVQDVVKEMQEPGYSVASTKKAIASGIGKGRSRKKRQGPVASTGGNGNLPIDTGFLRASLLASTSAMPAINPGARPVDGKSYSFDFGQIEAVIAGADIGQTLYFGYTAAYAGHVEYGSNGRPARRFVALAAQNWPTIVAKNASRLKQQLGL